MASSPYFLRISSQKGGVGKTVIAVNLAIALSARGKKVALADADLYNPSVGLHLNLKNVDVGIRDVLEGKVTIDKALVRYSPTGLYVLPGSVAEGEVTLEDENVDRVGRPLQQGEYDFVIFDTSPGILIERSLLYYNEVLMVTTPELPSLSSIIRLAGEYRKFDVRNEFVINRLTGEKHEMSVDEIEDGLGKKAVGMLPEDPEVRLSVERQVPLMISNEEAPFSMGIAKLADYYEKLVKEGS